MNLNHRITTAAVGIFILLLGATPLWAQRRMSLSEAIGTARSQSVAALEAKHAFVSTYWAYRSYQASRLPSLVLYGNLMNFDRSLTLLQSYEDGSFRYASTYNLQNSLGLQVAQNITFTGGRLYVYSDLSRIDQFGLNKKLTWYSQPVTVRYVQPLFSYNQFKWDKLIEPKEYERGRRRYVESMEQVTINAVSAYFSLVQALKNQEVVKANYENTEKMRSVAAERMRLGSVTRAEYLQLELRALNDSIAIGESVVNVRQAQMYLNSILGYDESVEVEPVVDDALPDILMDYGLVMEKALKNSTFSLDNQINELNAASNVAKAKADRGISMSLNARFGLSQTGNGLPDVYKDLLNQEVVGLTFSVPIFDWGLGKGKVQKAKAAEEAGADYVGAEELVAKIQGENWFDFDVVVATPNMMGVVGRLGRVLGPKGLMPNPKTGTVTMDVTKAIKDIKGGKVDFRVDKNGNLSFLIGKMSFTEQALDENFKAVADEVKRLKPSTVKGRYVTKATITSTMNPGVPVDPAVVA